MMVLVEYSESEDSDAEEDKKLQPVAREAATPHKPAFQKVVDRSNPHKIRVSLPTTSKPTTDDGEDGVAPPSKRVKVGPNAFSGFNSLLPAPKKAAASTEGTRENGARKNGLGSGVSLKTGPTPGFSRELGSRMDEVVEDNQAMEDDITQHGDGISNGHNYYAQESRELESSEKALTEPKKQGNSMIFKPLSVIRKSKKKKPAFPTHNETATQAPDQQIRTEKIHKVSLFAPGDVQDFQSQIPSAVGEYQPMIYQAHSTFEPPKSDFPGIEDSEKSATLSNALTRSDHTDVDQSSQSLSAVATDLNLSASAKRQLLGRQRNHTSEITVVNFNTDQEYAANEMLLQAGEQAQHNPVRAIAPGKHSLKQLVNAASNQKDALEEHFATGRRNKKEAGSKYGW